MTIDRNVAEIVTGNGGLEKVRVSGPHAQGEIYLHGAHVTSWKPEGQQEVLWMGGNGWWVDGKPIRGGVPICFPWFGPKKDAPEAPVHGTARLEAWSLESVQLEGDAVTVALSLKSDALLKKWFAADVELRFRASFGPKLTVQLETANTGNSAFSIEEALHTYFAVGDVRQVQVNGLTGCHYLDKIDGAREKTQEGAILITQETERVYTNTPDEVEIDDPVLKRRIRVSKQNSLDTVVWNPWVAKSKAMPDFVDDEWPGMICIETCNVLKDSIRIEPGQRHTMSAVFEVAGF